MNKFLLSIALCSALTLTGCDQTKKPNPTSNAQLDEIQQQLHLLTKEVIDIRDQIDALSSLPDNSKKVQLNEIPLKGGDSFLGEADAQIAIIEYMDYQCPYCLRHATKVLPALKRKYIDSGIVKYIVRDFPLEFHAEAVNAAKLAKCSANQDMFAEAHKLLIEKSQELNSSIYNSLAKDLSLNEALFEECFSDPKTSQAVNDSFANGAKLGVTGTPRFFIGKVEGQRLMNVISMSGAGSLDAFEKNIAIVLSEK